MVKIERGDLLSADTEAIVNTVNCVGVMGKGIALQFKKAYPDNFKAYEKACKSGQVTTGKMFVQPTGLVLGPRLIINFPTKKHWRSPSRISYIRDGLDDLIRVIQEYNIKSIALPPLGCGNGGLNWLEIKQLITQKLSALSDVDIIIFEPAGAPESSSQRIKTKAPKMTLFVAEMILLIKRYLFEEITLSRLEIQKLAYFQKEAGDPHFVKLDFEGREYGPYSDKLSHAIHNMDGHYLENCGDNNSPFKQIRLNTAVIEPAENMLADDKDSHIYLQKVFELINGFEDPFGMELLSTVHWTAHYCYDKATDVESAIREVHAWNEHKRKYFKPEHIAIAWERLKKYGWI